ncbi:reverse transcriptase domain-containing protein [Tanacetum coccineum]
MDAKFVMFSADKFDWECIQSGYQDGPFILDEILHWCKRKNKKAMFFKVDFAKAYDSVRWDYLLDVLEAFGFGRTWCNWIQGTLTSAKASILIDNEVRSKDILAIVVLKPGIPLGSPYLLYLECMESLHYPFTGGDEGLFHRSSFQEWQYLVSFGLQFSSKRSNAKLEGVFFISWCLSGTLGESRSIVEESPPRRNSARLGGCILGLTPNVFRARGVSRPCPSDCWYSRTIVTIRYLSSCPSNGKRGYVYASHALGLSVQVRLPPFFDLFFILEMAKDIINIVTSVLTQKELDASCRTYNIPANLRPELLCRDDTIRNNPEGKIGIGAGTPCCYTKNLDSLKNWNKHFFCIDASIYPISLSWFDIHSVERDLLPFDDVVDLNLIDRLNEGRAAIRKYLEIFLSVVGFSRSFVEEDVRPTFIGPNRCGTAFRVPPYPLNYLTRRLAIEEILAKFIDEGLGEPKPTRIGLKLADRSIQYPRGIVENMLIKVDKFVLPVDFVILDMPKDSRNLIILGRPFLVTTRAMIDVYNKKITLRVGDDEVIFDMDQSIKKPLTEDDECHGIDDLDNTINTKTQELLDNDQLDPFLLKGLEKSINQSDLESCNSIGDKFYNNYDVDLSIRRIDPVNTPYFKAQETEGTDRVKNTHLYSASTNEIDEKKPKLEDFSSHLEYAYLHVFDVWGLDFMGPFPQSRGNKYILVAVDYVSKWVEAQALPTNDARVVVRFLRQLFARMTYKTPTGCTHFRLVYGKACHLLVEIEHKSHWALKQCNMDLKLASEIRLMLLNELAELRDGAYENTIIYKERTKKWHDSRLRGDKYFKVGDKVLLYNSCLKMYPGKLMLKWSGPNIVKTIYPYGAIEIIDRNGFNFKVNGQ